MKILKRILGITLTAAIGLSAVGCGNSTKSTSDGSGSDGGLKTIRIASPTADAQLVENAALAQGLGYIDEELEKVGYKAEYSGFGQGGTAINEALSSDQVDITFVGDIPAVIAQSNGLDIQIVASLNENAEMGIVVGNNSGITSVADLKGKKIVAAFGTVTYVYLVNLLNANGMSIDDVEVINDIANGATLVASGDADAVISTGSGIYQFQAAGIGTVLTSSRDDDALSAQFFVYGNTSYISENPDAIKAIIKALIRSKDTANSEPDKVFETLATDDRPAEIVKQIYPAELGYDMFDPYLTQSSKDKYEATAKILLDGGIITSEVKADDIYNTKYLEEVYTELGLDIPQ